MILFGKIALKTEQGGSVTLRRMEHPGSKVMYMFVRTVILEGSTIRWMMTTRGSLVIIWRCDDHTRSNNSQCGLWSDLWGFMWTIISWLDTQQPSMMQFVNSRRMGLFWRLKIICEITYLAKFNSQEMEVKLGWVSLIWFQISKESLEIKLKVYKNIWQQTLQA